MSDKNKYLVYGLGATAALAIIGLGIWYASAEDEYENAKNEIEKLGRLKMVTSDVGTEVVDLE